MKTKKEKPQEQHCEKERRTKCVIRLASKGLGTTASSLIMIVIFMIFLGLYLYMANNQTQTTIALNIQSFNILKLKSTFFLFNKSLGATWLISTVQSVFITSDESIGCVTGGLEGYWYKTDPTKDRDVKQNDPDDRLPAGKYNNVGANPSICAPRDIDVTNYIKTTLGDFTQLKTPIDADGVTITLPTKSDGRVNTNIDIQLNDNKITSKFSQSIKAEYKDGVVEAPRENYNILFTSLKLMVAGGRRVVEALLNFGDSPPVYLSSYSNNVIYQSVVRVAITDAINRASSLPPSVSTYSNIETDIGASDASTKGVLIPGTGLVLHYTAIIRYMEGVNQAVVTPSGSLGWPTESRAITSCYGPRADPVTYDPGSFHRGIDIAPDSGQNLIKAVDSGTVTEINNKCPASDCEKDGEAGYGNYVLIKHNGFFTFYAHLESVSVSLSQIVNPGDAIGVMGTTGRSTGVHLHFEVRTDGTVNTRMNPCGYIACAESTGKKCLLTPGIDLAATSGVYYYNDEEAGTFEKRPIELDFNAEDYFPALNCVNIPPSLFNWAGSNDMACCGGYLFACNANIPKLPARQKLTTGGGIQSTPDTNDPNTICANALGSTVLQCTSTGFAVRSNPPRAG